jgi:hypothetical protein
MVPGALKTNGHHHHHHHECFTDACAASMTLVRSSEHNMPCRTQTFFNAVDVSTWNSMFYVCVCVCVCVCVRMGSMSATTILSTSAVVFCKNRTAPLLTPWQQVELKESPVFVLRGERPTLLFIEFWIYNIHLTSNCQLSCWYSVIKKHCFPVGTKMNSLHWPVARSRS